MSPDGGHIMSYTFDSHLKSGTTARAVYTIQVWRYRVGLLMRTIAYQLFLGWVTGKAPELQRICINNPPLWKTYRWLALTWSNLWKNWLVKQRMESSNSEHHVSAHWLHVVQVFQNVVVEKNAKLLAVKMLKLQQICSSRVCCHYETHLTMD